MQTRVGWCRHRYRCIAISLAKESNQNTGQHHRCQSPLATASSFSSSLYRQRRLVTPPSPSRPDAQRCSMGRGLEAAQSGAIADRHFQFSPDFLTTNFTDGAGRHSRKLLGSGADSTDGPRDDARARRIIQHAARRVAGLGWIGGCTVRLVLSPRTTPRRRPASSWWHGAPLANGGVAGAPPRRRTAGADLHCAVKSRRGAIASV